jgi:hypothetical protein
MAARKQGRVIRRAGSQTGKTHLTEDRHIHPAAMAPGMRISRKPNAWGPGGKKYFENRRSRSDVSKRKRV